MSRELLKIKCFNAKQLEEAKKLHKNYSLVPISKNGFKFVIMECWEETESLFTPSDETNTDTASEIEKFY